jgi:hypothetical protein
MNDLAVVLVKLQGAIESLQSREQDLTPIERLKLRALRLNLDVVQGSPTEMAQFPAEDEDTPDPLGEKLRLLRAISRETMNETRLLLAEAQSQIARGRSLCDAMRLAVERSELGCEQLAGAKRRQASDRNAI